MLASAPRKSGTSPTFQSASPRARKVGSKWLHVKTLLKATTVHLAHECMKHEAASRCRRWTANRRHLRRLPSSCMPPRRKAEPRQNPPRASGTGGRSIQYIAQPKWKPGSSCGKHIQKRESWLGKFHGFCTKRPQPFQLKCPCLIQTPGPRRRSSEESFATASSKWRRRSCSKKALANVPVSSWCLSRVEGTTSCSMRECRWCRRVGKTAPLAEHTKGRMCLRAVRKCDSKHGTL